MAVSPITTPAAVVDEEAAADDGAGVDFDPGEEARALGEKARDEAEFGSPEGRRDSMHPDGVQAGIAEHDHQPGAGRGVAVQDGADVFADGGEHDSSV